MISIRQQGFTLVEVIITLAIVVIVAGVSFPLYSHWQDIDALDSSRFAILQDVRSAQASAIAGENQSSFGVFFSSTEYTIYQGDAYTSREPAEDIVRYLKDDLILSGLSEVAFEKETGTPSTTGTLVITNTKTNNTESITVNDVGLIY